MLLLWPGVSAVVFCYAFGGVLLAYGVVTVVSFFLRDSRQGSFVFELLLGIIAAALGLLFLLRPAIVATILPVILGLFIVVDGLVNLKRALELRRMAYVRWNIPLWLSVGSVALGAFIVFQPFLAAEALVIPVDDLPGDPVDEGVPQDPPGGRGSPGFLREKPCAPEAIASGALFCAAGLPLWIL